jgi:hypothetical protein
MGLKDTVTDREAQQVLAHSPSPNGDGQREEKGEKDLVR